MKTIGLIGGTGWISTVEYYKIINQEVNKELGGLNASKCILYSINYADIDYFNGIKNRNGVFSLVLEGSYKLINAGVDCLVLCANTLHQFVDRLEPILSVPIINIASATANEVKNQCIRKVGLIGTKQTMEMNFYKDFLNGEGIEIVVPQLVKRNFIQNTISDELLLGIFSESSKHRLLTICNEMIKNEGAEGIILGCTEIPLILSQSDLSVPLFDTLRIHAIATVDFALNRTPNEKKLSGN